MNCLSRDNEGGSPGDSSGAVRRWNVALTCRDPQSEVRATRFPGQCEAALFDSSPSEQAIVFGVGSDPKPNNRIANDRPQSTVIAGDTY